MQIMFGISKIEMVNKAKRWHHAPFVFYACMHHILIVCSFGHRLQKGRQGTRKGREKATRMIRGMEGLPDERLHRLGLFSVEKNMLKGTE